MIDLVGKTSSFVLLLLILPLKAVTPSYRRTSKERPPAWHSREGNEP